MALDSPFGAPWDRLDLDDVQRFLAEPREEGQLWEAKGTAIAPRTVRKSVCGFANTLLGGYLVLGAEGDRKTWTWTLTGWDPPGEPHQWVTDCLRNLLDPLPP